MAAGCPGRVAGEVTLGGGIILQGWEAFLVSPSSLLEGLDR